MPRFKSAAALASCRQLEASHQIGVCIVVWQMHNESMKNVSFHDSLFTFAEALTATGAENLWLRTVLQRDKKGLIGVRHRTGRLLFSIRDLVAIFALWSLNGRLRVAPAAATEVVEAVEWIIGKSSDAKAEVIRIAFDAAGGALIWTRDPDGVVVTWSDRANENMQAVLVADQSAHIVLSMSAVLRVMAHAVRIAQEWPEESR